MSLVRYKAKRNFRQTPEPAAQTPKSESPFFVVQKHDATRLHYDFRLAMHGVLKSWAVPKGFPFAHGDRRLAVEVEDHPMAYANFEGTIPEGNYGAGTVMVWDRGDYEVQGDPDAALRKGRLDLTLRGKKLKGDWTLVRMRGSEKKPQWLVLKSGEETRPISQRAEDQSVLTGRSLKQIASGNVTWQSNRQTTVKSGGDRKLAARSGRKETAAARPSRQITQKSHPEIPSNLPKRKVDFVEPMKAILAQDLPAGPGWIYEIKFDGIRAVAIVRRGRVNLLSRNEKDLTAKYSGIAAALKNLPVTEAILDGEIVALDAQGRSSFQLLQSHNLGGGTKPPIVYYAFDVPRHRRPGSDRPAARA